MCCITLVRCVLVLRCGSAGVVWYPYVYWTVHHLDTWIKIDQLDVTCFIISLFPTQHVSNVSTSIFRACDLLWICFMCCIALVRCVLVLRCGRKFLKMDVLTFETCWAGNGEIINQVTSVGLSLFNYHCGCLMVLSGLFQIILTIRPEMK